MQKCHSKFFHSLGKGQLLTEDTMIVSWTVAWIIAFGTLAFIIAIEFWRRTGSAYSRRRAYHHPDLGDHIGVIAVQGRRQYMEDNFVAHDDLLGDGIYSLYGVLDGHGGAACSLFCETELPNAIRSCLRLENSPTVDMDGGPHTRTALFRAFEETDKKYLEMCATSGVGDGSTAVMALLRRSHVPDGTDVLSVANVGDSRAVLCHRGQAIPLSDDHKPTREDEKERIEDAGGRIVFWGTWRVEGVLALTRAIGDRPLKPIVSALPEIIQRPLVTGDEFIIVASDGLWDVVDSQRAINIVRSSSGGVAAAARALAAFAYNMGSADNITCLVVDLRKRNTMSTINSL